MLAAIFRIVALVRKELLAMLKDPRGRAVLFVPPVLQCIVFGYVVNYDLTRVAYVAFDRDRSAASSELLASLDGSGQTPCRTIEFCRCGRYKTSPHALFPRV